MSPLLVSVAATATRNARLLLVVIAVAWLAALCLMASLTPHAFVFSDEAGYFLPMLFGYDENNYRQWSILPAYPSYLYFQIYSLLPSGDLHASAKMLNACFIVGTAIPAYAVSRRYLAIPLAAAFAAIVMLSPISSFVRYVMPEPVYFFGFWLIVLVVLLALDKSPFFSAITGGALIGVLSLIKPHALALTLGLGGFFLLRTRCRGRGMAAAATLFLVYYAVHIILAFLLTGKWLWSVTGATYGGMLSGHGIDFLATMHNLAGHVGAIAALIAIPLAVTIAFVIRQRHFASTGEAENAAIQRLWDLGLLACCLLAVMVAMTVYFSQSVYQISPEGERITRLHGRYYFYVMPLFVLTLLGLWRAGVDLQQLISTRAFVIGCIMMMAAAASIGVIFELGAVDFPDMAVFSGLRGLLVTIGLLGAIFALRYCGGTISSPTRPFIATVIWWAAASLLTSAALLFIAPLRGGFQAGPVDAEFLDATDRLGLHKLVGRADGVIVGSPNSAVDVFRVMFYLRSLSAGKIISPGTGFRDDDFPTGARWAVFLPDVRYVGPAQVAFHRPVSVVQRP